MPYVGIQSTVIPRSRLGRGSSVQARSVTGFPLVAPITALSASSRHLGANGGELRLDRGRVAAYSGGRRIGYVRSPEIKKHLAAGGVVRFRADETLAGLIAVCSLC